MTAICKMTGKEKELPCSASGCPLFGDCIVEFQKGRRKSKPKQTNADRTRAMTDEELAKHLVDIGFDCHLCSEHRRLDNEPLLRNEKCDEQCEKHCLEWLQQPAEGE